MITSNTETKLFPIAFLQGKVFERDQNDAGIPHCPINELSHDEHKRRLRELMTKRKTSKAMCLDELHDTGQREEYRTTPGS